VGRNGTSRWARLRCRLRDSTPFGELPVPGVRGLSVVTDEDLSRFGPSDSYQARHCERQDPGPASLTAGKYAPSDALLGWQDAGLHRGGKFLVVPFVLIRIGLGEVGDGPLEHS
jgi:hypothetical protein